MSGTLRSQVEDFLFFEAQLLDEWRLDEWLSLFTPDARYVVPTTDLPDGDPAVDLTYIADDILALRGRVNRLKSRHAHREYPWSKTRRLITNVRAWEEQDGHIGARASFAVYRSRDARGRWSQTDVYVGEYSYRLVRVDGSFKIRYRKAVLDLEGLHGHGAISIIL
jgi:p-cumate 2,3-dioxygenase beta subunit